MDYIYIYISVICDTPVLLTSVTEQYILLFSLSTLEQNFSEQAMFWRTCYLLGCLTVKRKYKLMGAHRFQMYHTTLRTVRHIIQYGSLFEEENSHIRENNLQ